MLIFVFMEQNQTNRDLVVYVLARTDLPSLNCGKLAAQVHHAGVQMMAKHGSHPLVQEYVALGIEQGADNFNTTLALAANLSDIQLNMREAATLDPHTVVAGVVTDPSYPFFVENEEIAQLIPETDSVKVVKVLDNGRVLMVRPEITCAWFLGCRTNPEFRNLFAGLDLHP